MNDKRKMVWAMITVCAMITVYIWVSGIYYESETAIHYTSSEIELVDGRYVMSEEIVLLNTSETSNGYWGQDCANGIVVYQEYSRDVLGMNNISYYDFEADEHTKIFVGSSYSDYPRLNEHGDAMFTWAFYGWHNASIYHTENDTWTWDVLDGNGDELVSYGYGGYWEDDIAFISADRLGNTNNTANIYYGNNETIIKLFEDDIHGVITVTEIDINAHYVAWNQHDPTVVLLGDNISDSIGYLDRETGEVGAYALERLDYTTVDVLAVRTWGDRIVFEYQNDNSVDASFDCYGVGVLEYDGENWVRKNIYSVYEPNSIVMYTPIDLCRDVAVWSGREDASSGFNIKGVDIETAETFNITEVEDGRAYDPTVWIGDDGVGYVFYAKDSPTTPDYDLCFRYLNDTELMAEYEGLNEEPELETTEGYNTHYIYMAMMTSTLAVGLAMVDNVNPSWKFED